MKHIRKFNEEDSWIGDMYGRIERSKRPIEEQEPQPNKEPISWEEHVNSLEPEAQFRVYVQKASEGDPISHQKMIDLLKNHGTKLIKDRRYLPLRKAVEFGKEEVVDVLFDYLKKEMSPEDFENIKDEVTKYSKNPNSN